MLSRRLVRSTAAGVVLAGAIAAPVFAADHLDSPAVMAEPAADITDVYAWMTPDAAKVNLVMNVAPNAGAAMEFPTSIVYALHVNSSASYGAAQTETLVRCRFYAQDRIECWAGDEYVTGDPSDPGGITSTSGRLRVFAGLRDDPFYFELDGFNATVGMVRAAAGGLTFDGNGCPALDEPTATALVTQLQRGRDGAPASNTFAGQSVLSLVVQVDKSVVASGGPVLGVWGSTHRVGG